MYKEAREEICLRFKLLVLEWSTHFGPTKTCREFEVAKSTFYEWKNAYTLIVALTKNPTIQFLPILWTLDR